MALVDLETPAALAQNHRGRLQSAHVLGRGLGQRERLRSDFLQECHTLSIHTANTAGRRPAATRSGASHWSGPGLRAGAATLSSRPPTGFARLDGRLSGKQEGRRLCEAVDCHSSGHRGRGKLETPSPNLINQFCYQKEVQLTRRWSYFALTRFFSRP